RMLDMGFIHDIRRVIALLPKGASRQNLLFSATFSREIKNLSKGLLNDPKHIEVAAKNATADKIEQLVYPVDKSRKRALLSHLISSKKWGQVLVFSRTKHGANKLCDQLIKDGLSAAAIHGNKSQGARTRALSEFKRGDVQVLVATDIAARGLDINQLPHVVNYELPNVPEDYVHRIGRTARAGNSGEAISLVSNDEVAFLRDIERLLNRKLPSVTLEGYEPTEAVKLVALPKKQKNQSRPGKGKFNDSVKRRKPKISNSKTAKPKKAKFKGAKSKSRKQPAMQRAA
ncbi:MAG: DEAD/DEAH box helicase, partial [bacterium]